MIFPKDFTCSRKPVMCSTKLGIYYGMRRSWGTVTSSNAGVILDFISIHISRKNEEIEFFNAGHIEYDITKHFCCFLSTFCAFLFQKGKKTRIFLQKWLLLMASSYDVISRDHSSLFFQSCAKGICTQLLKKQV